MSKLPLDEAKKLTGYTQGQLSKLATKGYYAPSADGVFHDRDEVLAGVIRYLKETKERVNTLKESILATKDERDRIELDELKKKFMLRAKAQADLEFIEGCQRKVYQKMLESEWPKKAVGKTEIELIEIGRATTNELCAMLRGAEAYKDNA